MIKFIASVAALALAASSLHADPGGGQGKGGGNREQGNGGGKGPGAKERPDQAQPARSRDNGGKGKDNRPDSRAEAPRGNVERQARGPDRSDSKGNSDRADRAPRSAEFAAPREDRRDKGRDAIRPVGGDRRDFRTEDREPGSEPFRWARLERRDVVQGCPPGLAKKLNGCLPPGQAKLRNTTWAGTYDRPDWWGYDDYQGRYSYYDGRLLQLGNNGSILGYLPLLGGSLAPGNLWPSFYEPVEVPDYYQSYYNLGSDDSYRYYDDAFYSVDPQTQAISAIAALLTGDDFAVGEPLPDGYDIYNVPYSYRDEYVDGPDAAYRYSDGYIYEVDPTTQLIRTTIELLT